MDNNNKKSLVTKIIEKGIITPYEAIHLQHLNTKNARDQLKNMDLSGNYYLRAEELSELVPPPLLKQVLTFRNEQDGRLYEAYQWVGNDMGSFESRVGEIGYKGLALLNEIRYMRSENCLKIVLDMDQKKPVTGSLFEYKTYSRVNQKRVTFNEVLGSFGVTFRLLITTIDIILTENYYLQNLFDLDDLDCLMYLKMWLGQESQEEDPDEEDEPMSPFFNITRACCRDALDFILDDHHPKIVELIRVKTNSFGINNLPTNFEKGSLDYVKETIKMTVDSISNVQKVD
jgi:hypothetical protein